MSNDNSNKFNGFNIKESKNFELPDSIRNMDVVKLQAEQAALLTERRVKEEEHKAEMLKTLKNIEANTVGLNEIIPLLSGNLEKQEEVLDYLKEALAISASRDPKEAEGKYREMMSKASQLKTDIETVNKLSGFARTIYDLYLKMYGG